MNIRLKVLLTTGIAVAIALVLAYAVIDVFAIGAITSTDEKIAQQNLHRPLAAIDQKIAGLDSRAKDWSAWDDSYAFAQDGNQEYVETNLYAAALNTAGFDIIAFFNSSGHLVYAARYDRSGNEVPVPIEISGLQPGDPLLTHESLDSSRAGLLPAGSGLLMVSSHPILTSLRGGPPAGTLVVARFLAGEDLEDILAVSQANFTVRQISDPDLPKDMADAFANAANTSEEDPVYLVPLSEETMGGYHVVDDIHGQPTILLAVYSSRQFYQGMRSGIDASLQALVALGIFAMAVFLFTIDRNVLSRVSQLDAQVDAIREGKSPVARVPVQGSDELSHLAISINETFSALKSSERKLTKSQAERARELEKEVHARTKELEEAKAELEKSTKKLGAEGEALMSMMSGMSQNYKKLKEMDLMKDQFLRMTTHELDTPLVPMKMQAQLWLDGSYGKITQKQRQSFEVILRNADRLITLIDDVMMMSKLDAGRLLFEFKPADLGSIARDAVVAHEKVASKKRISISLEIQKKLPKAEMDSEHIRQALNLYLDNAVKFTEKGSITVSVARKNGSLEVLVKDTGVGMAPEVLAKIFGRFYQGDKTITRKHGGTGLGLPIAKAIIDKHGGKVWAESEGLGKGSTFGFSIPVRR